MTNPTWGSGLRVLCQKIASRIGYEDIALQPVLFKVILFGPGGHLEWGRADDKDDHVVVKLVLQLPSKHTGGDMLVFDEESQKQFCYNLGKVNGTAAFEPQLFVYDARAYRAVAQVTSGYALMVEYSLYLPPDHSSKRGNITIGMLRMQLAEAIEKTTQHDETRSNDEVENTKSSNFALVLSESCKLANFDTEGVDALSGLELHRFQLLRDANALLSAEKQIKSYIACFRQAYGSCDTKSSVSWYSITGEKLGGGDSLKLTRRFNILNPERRTLNELLGGYDATEHERWAIVGWPASADIVNIYEFMGELGAINIVLAGNPIQITKARALFNNIMHADDHSENEETSQENQCGRGNAVLCRLYRMLKDSPVTLDFCQKLCPALVDAGDSALVEVFLQKYFPRLNRKAELIPWLATLVQKFGWDCVGSSLVIALNSEVCDIGVRMSLALKLADNLKYCSEAQTALTIFAVEKARDSSRKNPVFLTTSVDLGMLWKHAMLCKHPSVFRDLVDLFNPMDAKLLGPVAKELLNGLDDSSSSEHRDAMTFIAFRRRQCLAAQIAAIEKTIVWKVPVGNFPDASAVTTFLQGPQQKFKLASSGDVADTNALAALLRTKIQGPLQVTVEGEGKQSCIKLLKTGGAFVTRRKTLQGFKIEMEHLVHVLPQDENAFGTNVSAVGKKRPREEHSVGGAVQPTFF